MTHGIAIQEQHHSADVCQHTCAIAHKEGLQGRTYLETTTCLVGAQESPSELH